MDLNATRDLAERFDARLGDSINFQSPRICPPEVATRIIEINSVRDLVGVDLGADVAGQGNPAVPSTDFGSTQFAAIEIDPHQGIPRLGGIGAEEHDWLCVVGRKGASVGEKKCGGRCGVVSQPCAGSISRRPRWGTG